MRNGLILWLFLLSAMLSTFTRANIVSTPMTAPVDLGRGANPALTNSFRPNNFKLATLEEVREAAKKANPDAEFELGERLTFARGVAKDLDEAFGWLLKAAKQGHMAAAYEVGHCYTFGEGVATNYFEGRAWYERAAEKGSLAARHNLAVGYMAGRGGETNMAEAAKQFRIAAEGGLAESQVDYALCLLREGGDWAHMRQVFEWAGKSAHAGLARGESLLGDLYANGMGTPKNIGEAEKWMLRGAVQNDAYAEADLGNLYAGMYGPRLLNIPEALRRWRTAAGRGVVFAQFNLANYLSEHDGPEDQKLEAVRWLRAAIEQGSAPALASLGLLYKKGIGVQKNPEEAFRLFSLGAARGDVRCQGLKGVCLRDGEGTAADVEGGLKLIREAAEKRDFEAEMALGESYLNGLGVTADEEEGRLWYERAAGRGYPPAKQFLLTRFNQREPYQRALAEELRRLLPLAQAGDAESQVAAARQFLGGLGTEKNVELAVKLLRAAYAKGHPEAAYLLGQCLFDGLGGPRDLAGASEYFEAAAAAGSADAELALARIQFADPSGRNAEKAVKTLLRFAETGQADAQSIVGYAYVWGHGTPRNETIGTNWLGKAAANGNGAAKLELAKWFWRQHQTNECTRLTLEAAGDGFPNAQFAAFILYRDGSGVNTDMKVALDWCRKAATNRCVDAQKVLADIYRRGIGVERDLKEAYRWNVQAAEQGDAQAQHDTGVMLASQKKFEAALKWFRKAADQGYAPAQGALAYSYEKGNGVPRDLAEAYKWYSIAVERGVDKAKPALENLIGAMSAEELAEGKKRFAAAPRLVETPRR